MKKIVDIDDAGLRYLEHRAHTKKEMRDHLRKKEYEENEIEDLIKRFAEVHYLDDAAYSSMFMKYAFGKGWSYNRVRMELRKRGVDDADAEKGRFAFEDEYEIDIDSEEEKRAAFQAEKFMKTAGSPDKKTLAKLGRRLSGFGYTPGVIYKVTGKYMTGHYDE